MLLPFMANSLTPIFCCGFECGIITNSPHVNGFTGSPAISTSIVRSGSRSLSLASSSDMATLTLGVNKLVGRVYVYFSSVPGSGQYNFLDFGSSGCYITLFLGKIYPNSSGTISGSGFTPSSGVWYALDFEFDRTTSTTTTKLTVNGTDYGTATHSSGLTDMRDLYLGGVSGGIYVDDLIISTTLTDYPIGAGYVNHFVPTSDGTHTSTSTNIRKGTTGTPSGTAITSSTTDAYAWLNAVPLGGGATDNTRLQNANSSATTQYTEVVYGPAPGILTPISAPRAVEVIVIDRQSSTNTIQGFSMKLNDNGTESIVLTRSSSAGVTTDRYTTKQYATSPSGVSWNANSSGNGAFNNIRMRFGYATRSGSGPNDYFRGTMIEAEFPEPHRILIISKR